jgi:two-component system, sensor histidine kinase
MNETAKILVVDDQESGRFVKMQTLRRAGYHVIEASTGNDALTLAESEGIDLIVLDVNLPDISGLEVSRRLRAQNPTLPGIQILQVSNTAITPADQVRGLQQGADVYLTEPIEPTVLVATVQALLRVRRTETALARALAGEREARQSAEQASRLKDEFIATLSHELRTPLNALMGWIWQLRHTSLGTEARERALDSLERNTRMQAQLINDLIDVSRASKGKLQLEMRLVDLQMVVTSANEFVREAVERKELELREQLTPVSVAGDLARLQQIVTNLLTNAVQFTPRKGRITVSLSARGDEAVLTVEDTGAGIEPAFLPYVFDQFRQGEGGLARTHGGLGLGLTVVKQLVDLHGGTVTVDSRGTGQGASFTVCLPLEGALAEDRAPGNPLLLQDVNVRVVATEGVETSMLRSILEASGATVSVATGAHTLEAVPVSHPDVTLTDTGADSWTLNFPQSDERSQSLAKSTSPSDIVRRIARMLKPSNAR